CFAHGRRERDPDGGGGRLRAPSGSSTWTDLTEGGAYSGTTTGTLTVSAITTAMSGDQFRLAATNGTGTANSSGVTLTVTAASSGSSGGGSTSGSGGGGGGGGRLDWLLLALLSFGVARRCTSRAERSETPVLID